MQKQASFFIQLFSLNFLPTFMNPSFLTIGHLCQDKIPQGFLPGGATAYGATVAQQLGLQPAILTSFGKDFQFENKFSTCLTKVIPSAKTTIFENKIVGDKRTQTLHQKASDINTTDLPEEWRSCPIIHLCPIADEVSLDFLNCFPKESMVCVSPQGWMRQWDESGTVKPKRIEDWSIFKEVDFLCISEEDIDFDWKLANEIATYCPFLVVTKGQHGLCLFHQNKKTDFPAFKTTAVDTTGAGDVLASSLVYFYYTFKDINKAILYAIATASIAVESTAMSFSLNYASIEERSRLMARL